ncbi:MAG TPA: hypothetical protein VGD98_19885 [Ktedonobacteraceae bacterium]
MVHLNYSVEESIVAWDLIGKALVKECVEDFLDYFAPGAEYVGMRNVQLQTRADSPFATREIRADVLVEAVRDGQHILLDIEWQSTKDDKMDDRLLFYSSELTREYDIVVLPIVIYLQAVGDVPEPPLTRLMPGKPLSWGNTLLTFHFVSLEIRQVPIEELRAIERDAFHVLMLLSKGGATREGVNEVLDRLLKRREKRKESIVAAFFFAGKVMKSDEDQKFINRRREMIKDSLQDTWLYKELYVEAQEEAHEKGHEEDIKALVQVRFLELLPFVQSMLASLADRSKLQEILILVGTAQTADELQQALAAYELK